MNTDKAEIFHTPQHFVEGGYYGGDVLLCISLDGDKLALDLGGHLKQTRHAKKLADIINAGIAALAKEANNG